MDANGHEPSAHSYSEISLDPHMALADPDDTGPPPAGQCVLLHSKNCSGTAQGTWGRGWGVDLASKCPQIQKSDQATLDLPIHGHHRGILWPLGGFIVSETIFSGGVVGPKKKKPTWMTGPRVFPLERFTLATISVIQSVVLMFCRDVSGSPMADLCDATCVVTQASQNILKHLKCHIINQQKNVITSKGCYILFSFFSFF